MSSSKKEVRNQKATVSKDRPNHKRKRPDGTDEAVREPPAKKTSQPQRPKQTSSDENIAMMDPSLLADHFAKTIRKCFADSSSLEHEDRYVATKSFRDTTEFDKSRIASNLPEFLTKFTSGGSEALSTSSEGEGPHTWVITPSGIRTADVARELRVFSKKDSQVAKLIAKHMKLKQNIEHFKNNRVGIAISTPMRLRDLAEAEALKISSVKRIVVDGSYQDEKKRSIFDLDELFRPLVELFNRLEIKSRLDSKSGIEILVF